MLLILLVCIVCFKHCNQLLPFVLTYFIYSLHFFMSSTIFIKIHFWCLLLMTLHISPVKLKSAETDSYTSLFLQFCNTHVVIIGCEKRKKYDTLFLKYSVTVKSYPQRPNWELRRRIVFINSERPIWKKQTHKNTFMFSLYALFLW